LYGRGALVFLFELGAAAASFSFSVVVFLLLWFPFASSPYFRRFLIFFIGPIDTLVFFLPLTSSDDPIAPSPNASPILPSNFIDVTILCAPRI